MPRRSPYDIQLTEDERAELTRRANSLTLPYSTVLRARMIVCAAQGMGNHEIASRLATRREIVSRWRKRFFERRLEGLQTQPRRGRPPIPNRASGQVTSP
jgi:putative transposase